MESLPLGDATFFQYLNDSRLSNYMTVIALSALFYDFIVTFDIEIEHIWMKKWSPTTCLFLFNRYPFMIYIIMSVRYLVVETRSDFVCKRILGTQLSLTALFLITTQLMLAYRIWILYGKKLNLLYFLLPLILAETIASAILVTLSVQRLGAFIQRPRLTGCHPIGGMPPLLRFYMVATSVVTGVMFIFAIYKCLMTLYENRFQNQPLLQRFCRDGVVWFIAVLGWNLTQVLLLLNASQSRSEFMLFAQSGVYGVASARLYLNMKNMGTETEFSDQGKTLPVMSEFRAALPSNLSTFDSESTQITSFHARY
ncbi:hypothetical protein BDQ12DRAFT_736351 [Crucibulum laeve]|uniref:DUF6533 domain-containing protein n=1 Tax=Crucibulum laeve TaxID=68775 RepID=A0A5C3LVH2_9AGAR|nr:hypothetical protein BDQ12DRAFT_736351 [Crucibulum laeve]